MYSHFVYKFQFEFIFSSWGEWKLLLTDEGPLGLMAVG